MATKPEDSGFEIRDILPQAIYNRHDPIQSTRADILGYDLSGIVRIICFSDY